MKLEKKAVSGMMTTLLLVGMLILAFDIQTVEASGTIYIRADGSVDPPAAPIEGDGNIYTFTDNIYNSIVVERDNIVIDGNGYTLQGTGTGSGFVLSIVSGVTVKNTYITHFEKGVAIFYFEGPPATGPIPVQNTIANNTITNCSWYGIEIFMLDSTWTSHEHHIIGNTIRNNEIGVALTGNTRYNKVYHNNFLNNSYQAYDSTSQTNWWSNNYPNGGNYWSDYTDVDLFSGPFQNETGSDGIGDTPYIFENNQDDYPLMFPHVLLLGDLNVDFKVDIRDIVRDALAFGSYPKHPRWNPQADINQDGKVDIRDITLIAKNFGKTYP